MSDKIDYIITHRNMRYVPWYAFGVLGGSITFMGISGMALIYTIFITTLVLSCGIKSYFDYLVNSESNFVIRNVKSMTESSKITIGEKQNKTHNTKLRLVLNTSLVFKAISFMTFMLILSVLVNSIIFLNLPLLYSSLSHAIIASIVYYMVSFLLNVMSVIKYREI